MTNRLSPSIRAVQRMVRTFSVRGENLKRINLCSGTQRIPGYCGIDFVRQADIVLDLSKNDLPLLDDSVDVLICMSAINYFSRNRGQEIVREVHRVLKLGGVARFGVQDMEDIARRYVAKDESFFMQKTADGSDRFEGPTLGDKFAAWFYGYAVGEFPCRYFYDFASLSHLFVTAGFRVVERKQFGESAIGQIELIDNRPDQMFFLEAIK